MPESIPQVVSEAVHSLPEVAQARMMEHISGGTSASWLEDWFMRAGYSVSATSIKRARRAINRGAA